MITTRTALVIKSRKTVAIPFKKGGKFGVHFQVADDLTHPPLASYSAVFGSIEDAQAYGDKALQKIRVDEPMSQIKYCDTCKHHAPQGQCVKCMGKNMKYWEPKQMSPQNEGKGDE